MQVIDLLALLVVGVLWGSQYLLNNLSLKYVPPTDLSLIQTFVPFFFLLLTSAVQQYFTRQQHLQEYQEEEAQPLNPQDNATGKSKRRSESNGRVSRRSSTLKDDANKPPVIRWRDVSFWKKSLLQFCVVGVLCQGLGNFTFSQASDGFSSGVLGIIFCLEPVFSALFAVLFKVPNAKLTRMTCCGMLVSLVGITMVVYPDVLHGTNGIARPDIGFLTKVWFAFVAIVSPAIYGLSAIVNQIFMTSNPLPLYFCLTGQTFFGFIYMTLQSIVQNVVVGKSAFASFHNIIRANPLIWVYSLGMTISSSVICWGLFLWLIKRIGARASLYAFLVPCVALVLGAIVNHEWADLSGGFIALQIFGVFIVLGGMALIVMEDFGHFQENADKKGVLTARASVASLSVHTPENNGSFRKKTSPSSELEETSPIMSKRIRESYGTASETPQH